VAINLGTPEGGAPGLADQQLTPHRLVLLSRSATQRAQESAALTAPASFAGATSIAYRLARVAAGDAVATLTLHGAQSWDLAAGHALLLGAGGVLLDQDGHPVRYANDGSGMVSACFGGAPAAARELASRTEAWARAAQER
jgi:fructose-1,6-bisphosphatase/inositol monophosphatase family enzyme